MIGGIDTGAGFWNPLLWLIAIIAIAVAVYAFRELGERKYKKRTEQVKPFLSGNVEYDKARVPGENIYWGFTEALRNYYDKIVAAHTGIINDYMYWFVCSLAVFLALIALAGGIE